MITDVERPKLGFLGLGLMGSAMVERLLARGHSVTVWNREPEAVPPMVGKGAQSADSPADLAAASDIVCLCVLDTAAVEAVVFGESGVAKAGAADKVLVDHSTAMPEATARMAERLDEACGMAWVDAPVSGGPGFARDGRLTIMAGGTEAAFDRVRPILDDTAANVTRMGPAGAGQMAKVINQGICGVSYVLMAEILRLAELSGIDAGRVPACLAGGHADSVMLNFAYPKMLARDFDPPASLTRQMLKDLHNVVAEGHRFGLDLPVIATAEDRFARYSDNGGALRETASVYYLYNPDDEGAPIPGVVG